MDTGPTKDSPTTTILDRRPVEVQLEQATEHLAVRQIVGPAIGIEDGRVEPFVGLGEPRRARVVQVGEGVRTSSPSDRPGGLSQPSRSSTSRREAAAIASRCSLGHARERERLEASSWRVAEARLDLAQLRARPSCPELVNARVQDAERVVVIAGKDDERVIRDSAARDPHKEAMLGGRGSRDEPRQLAQGLPHARDGLSVQPPPVAIGRPPD